MSDGQQLIYFDSTYTLRVVEEDKFKDTERLRDEAEKFSESALVPARCPALHAAPIARRPQTEWAAGLSLLYVLRWRWARRACACLAQRACDGGQRACAGCRSSAHRPGCRQQASVPALSGFHVPSAQSNVHVRIRANARTCAEMGEFQQTVKSLVEGMNKQGARIEAAKLKVITRLRE